MRKKTGRALAVFFMHLAQSEKAGIPLRQSLEAAQNDSDDRTIARAAADMAEAVREGATLGEAMAASPALFDATLTGLVATGEKSGRLSRVLQKCNDLVRHRLERQSQVARGTLGPKISTVILLALVSFRQGPDALYTLGLFLALWVLVMLGRFYAPAFRHATDFLVLFLPGIGAVVRHHCIARFCENFAILQESGVEMKKSIHLAGGAVPNLVLRQETHEALLMVEAGASLHHSFSVATRFDSLALGLIKAGEDSGNLANTLNETAAYYDRKTDEAITALQQTLVPALVIFLGIVLYLSFRDSGFTAPFR